MIEQLLFTIIAFGLFVYIFFKMIQKKNYTNYIFILILQTIGILLNFIEVLAKIELNIVFIILKYILAILVPISVWCLDRKGIPLIQVLNVVKAKIYLKLGNNKKKLKNN